MRVNTRSLDLAKHGAGKWNAFNLFHLFTRFDKAIFGHKKFIVKDKQILAGMGVKNQETATVELVGDKNTAAKLVRVPYCTDYDVCISPCASKAHRCKGSTLLQSVGNKIVLYRSLD